MSQAPVLERGAHGRESLARAHRRPARLRGGDAGRLPRDAGRPDARGRRRRRARHLDAARRPLQGHLGAVATAPVNAALLAAAQHRDAGRPGQRRAPTCRRAPPRTCSGSAATASAATTRRACCAWRSTALLDEDGDATGGVPPALALARAARPGRRATTTRRPRCCARRRTRTARWPSGCASSRASPSPCATACRSTTGAPSTGCIGDPVFQRSEPSPRSPAAGAGLARPRGRRR